MKNKIFLVAGDPNSINSEIIYKSWKKLNKTIKKNLFIIGNYNLISKQFRKLNISKRIFKQQKSILNVDSDELKIINIPLKFKDPFKVPEKDASKYVLQSLNLAHQLIIKKGGKGIVNCPIDKKLLNKSNKVIGVTEYLASKCNCKNSEVMMLHNKKMSVVPLTTHLRVKDISRNLTQEIILKKIITLNNFYKKLFKKKPYIGVLGLNPHNGEYQKNSEELLKIIPSISILKKKKLKIKGPLVADTTFINNFKIFDVIVGMYHDQVLIPFKTLFKFDAINITLGLDYIRVSPDHGPAIDLIGHNKANYESLNECIKFLHNLN